MLKTMALCAPAGVKRTKIGITSLAAVIGLGVIGRDTGSGPGGNADPVTGIAGLETAIGAAGELQSKTETGGIAIAGSAEDVPIGKQWTTQEEAGKLKAAITAADTALKTAATQTAVNNALAALNAAITAFNQSLQDGAKETGGDGDCGHGGDCECGYDENEWKSDDDHHWNECECGTELNSAEHD